MSLAVEQYIYSPEQRRWTQQHAYVAARLMAQSIEDLFRPADDAPTVIPGSELISVGHGLVDAQTKVPIVD